MQKLKLKPIYDYTLPRGAADYSLAIRDHVCYRLLTDEQVEWLYNNTEGRFFLDGHYIFFDLDGDALAFKMRWL